MPFGALKPSFSLVGTFARRSSVAILLMPFGALKHRTLNRDFSIELNDSCNPSNGPSGH